MQGIGTAQPGHKMLALEEGMKSLAGRVPSKRPVRGPRILSYAKKR